MSKIKKHLIGFDVLMLMVLLTTCLHQSALAQVDPCSKPKVAVIMQVVEVNEGEFFKHLNEQYPSQPKGSWFYEIQEKVMEELRMNSPGTQFIPATGGIPSDCDYSFKYGLSLTGGGEDIEYAGHLKLSEDTLYQMHSTLRKIPSCGKKTYVLSVKRTKNMDIFHTIEQNIVAHGNIGNKIKENEESHRVPPRGPEMKVSQDREYVSPLKEERKLKIKIDVINCKGEPVYDPKHGQEVILPKKTGRGELKCTDGFPEGCKATSNALTLIIQKPKGASATYTLKNGVNAEEDPINISTCGIDKKVVKETKIQIHGLELKVKPERKSISTGEKTDIKITFNEVDTKGKKYPVSGKELEIKVKGIVDGNISAKKNYITDEQGDVVLTYRAGSDDKGIKITAKYQPKDYPESVQDEGTVEVATSPVSARITLTSERTSNQDGTLKNYYGSKTIVKDNSYKTISVTILASFEEKPEVDFAFDSGKSFYQQKVTGYNYKITDYKVISETYSDEGTSHEARYDNAGRLRLESKTKYTGSGTSKKIELQSIESNKMSLDVDKTTGKISHVDFPFFEVMFIVNEDYHETGRKGTGPDDLEPINISDKKSHDYIFWVQPPLDSCENVIGGDGVHYVLGKCVKEHTEVDGHDTRTRTEKITYQWEVRR